MDVSDQSFAAGQPASRNPNPTYCVSTAAQPHEACQPRWVAGPRSQIACLVFEVIHSFIHSSRHAPTTTTAHASIEGALEEKKGSPPAGAADLTIPGPPRQRGSLSGAFFVASLRTCPCRAGQCHLQWASRGCRRQAPSGSPMYLRYPPIFSLFSSRLPPAALSLSHPNSRPTIWTCTHTTGALPPLQSATGCFSGESGRAFAEEAWIADGRPPTSKSSNMLRLSNLPPPKKVGRLRVLRIRPTSHPWLLAMRAQGEENGSRQSVKTWI